MAERRMIARSVCQSDAFRLLSAGAKSLYLQLVLAADDDGCVGSPIGIMRADGGCEEDLAALAEAGFLLRFPSGVAVVTHWRLHNSVKPDRYRKTIYQAEMADIVLVDDVYTMREPAAAAVVPACLQSGSSLEPEWNQSGTGVVPECLQSGSKVEPQGRLGEDRLISPLPERARARDKRGLVLLTEDDVSRLGMLMGESVRDGYIDHLSEYLFDKGKHYDDHAKVILKWWQEDRQKGKPIRVRQQTQKQDGGSFETEEFFDAAVSRTYGRGDQDQKQVLQ